MPEAAPSLATPDPTPRSLRDKVHFENRALNKLSDPLFRLSLENREPCLFFNIDGRPAMLTMPALASVCEIRQDSDDGAMLAMVSRALSFRRVIRLGDGLPTEVTTGEASWIAPPQFQLAASAHVRLCLLSWQGAEEKLGALDPAMLTTADPAIKTIVTGLFAKAATAIEPKWETRQLQMAVETVATELAYIDAVHGQVTAGLRRLASALRKLGRSGTVIATQREIMMQTLSLLLIEERAVAAIADGCRITPANVETTLRSVDTARTALRTARDRLYETRTIWGGEFERWDGAAEIKGDAAWAMVSRLYKFAARNQVTRGM